MTSRSSLPRSTLSMASYPFADEIWYALSVPLRGAPLPVEILPRDRRAVVPGGLRIDVVGHHLPGLDRENVGSLASRSRFQIGVPAASMVNGVGQHGAESICAVPTSVPSSSW